MLFNKIKDFFTKNSVSLFLSAVLIGTGVFAGAQYAKMQNYKRELTGIYEMSFYELVGAMESIDVHISKLQVSSSPGESVEILSSISRQSDFASSSLSALPVSHPAIMNTMTFLNTLGDYCRSLTKKAGDGIMLQEGDYVNLESFRESCMSLRTSLESINYNNIEPTQEWEYYQMVEQNVYDPFSIEEAGGIEFPTIIYDGPFSDALTGITPQGLGTGEIDEEQAKQIAATALNISVSFINLTSQNSKNMDGYTFSTDDGDSAFISKTGGKTIWMMKYSKASFEKLSYEECLIKANEYLDMLGIDDMVDTWSQTYDGQTIISFANVQKGCIVYPDLVKVKVDMEDGSITAVDALGYYMNHINREFKESYISAETASDTILGVIEIIESNLCLIPDKGGSEILCWEFFCSFNQETYIIYINAKNGIQERIYKIVDTVDGALVV